MAKTVNTITSTRTKILGVVCNVLMFCVAVLALGLALLFRLSVGNDEGLAAALGIVLSLVFGIIGAVMLVLALLFFADTKRAKRNFYGAFPLLFMLVCIVAIVVLIAEATGGNADTTTAFSYCVCAVIFALDILYCLSRMGDRKKFVAGSSADN